MRQQLPENHAVVLFDGVCRFCNWAVNFLLKADRTDVFRFVPLQSELGRQVGQHFNIPVERMETLVVIDGNRAHTFSAAVFQIVKRLGWPWRVFNIFSILPRAMTDFAYRLCARHRYRVFGRHRVCRVPTEAERAKFLDSAP